MLDKQCLICYPHEIKIYYYYYYYTKCVRYKAMPCSRHSDIKRFLCQVVTLYCLYIFMLFHI